MAATTFELDDTARALIDGWVREGYYASVEEVIAAGIYLVRDQVDAAWRPSAEDIAAIREGQADIAAGRVHDADTVFAELEARYTAMSAQR